MADLNDFKNIMGEIKTVIMEGNMEIRNERVDKIESKKMRPDKYSGEDTYMITVTAHPGKDERYGNRYSGFFTESKGDKLFGGLSRDDFAGKDVKIGFEWRPYEKDGVTKQARELKHLSLRDIDVNTDVKPIEMTENPLLGQPDMGYDNLPDALPPEHPVLAPESAVEALPTEKGTQGKGKGTPPSTDMKISRMNTSTTAFGFYGDLVRAGLVKNEDEAVERAFKLYRTLEEDINR